MIQSFFWPGIHEQDGRGGDEKEKSVLMEKEGSSEGEWKLKDKTREKRGKLDKAFREKKEREEDEEEVREKEEGSVNE